jgi:hypothetical protein
MPVYDGSVKIRAAAAYFAYPSARERMDIVHGTFGCSLLGRAFSTLWAQALNNAEKGLITHFAMLHSDIGCSQHWLDVLMEELVAHNADICSAVSPIKDMKGLTSTAIDDPQNPWQPKRRLTMTEIARLPETFDAMDCAKAALNPERAALLINTGCFLADVRKPWVLGNWTQNAPLAFTINDRMYRGKDRTFWVDSESEDWYFSRQAARCGAKIIATRKVQIEHFGEISWSNTGTWGEWKHDQETLGPVPPEKQHILEPEPGEGDGQTDTVSVTTEGD